MLNSIVTLVSVGAHPVSLRPRLAELDARALGVALAVASSAGQAVTALHSGSAADAEVLRACAGIGASQLLILDLPREADPLPALLTWLEAARPSMILAGACAETGECSGMLPFHLAERLRYRLAPGLVSATLAGDAVSLVQALPGGKRRTFEVELPLVATVGRSAAAPRLGAMARALRAEIKRIPGQPAPRDGRWAWTTRPGRARARRLEPFSATAEVQDRREMVRPDPVSAADAILDFLERESLFRPARTTAGDMG